MGHTVTSQRQVSEQIMRELSDFKRSLKEKDREHFDALLNAARKHYGSVSYTSSYQTWAILLLSMLLEQQKQLKQ